MKNFRLISAGLAALAFLATGTMTFAWPHKQDKSDPKDQVVYPIGPDTDGYFTTRTGLKFKDESKGDGQRPRNGQTVVVHYTGWLTDGKKFDSSVDRGTPFEFVLGEGAVIKGWDEGVKGMNIGGKRRLVIPPQLGYGSKGAGDAIPPNAKLIFDVQLLGVK